MDRVKGGRRWWVGTLAAEARCAHEAVPRGGRRCLEVAKGGKWGLGRPFRIPPTSSILPSVLDHLER